MTVSILILTKNEERDLPGCLESVSWSNDIVVYDSLSSDNTQLIAKKYGARIVEREFDNWSSHQNWGLKNIQFKNKWVFYIDADERMSSELIESVQALVNKPDDNVAFRIQRRDFWGGRWLKHVQASKYYIRLFMPEYINYQRLVNPITNVDGNCGVADGYLNHFPFSKGIGFWFERHNSYSSFEAAQIVENRKNNKNFSVLRAFIEVDFNKRRFHQKELFYRLPGRALIKFILFYFVRFGFLDGRPGFNYAVIQSIYEQMIVLKVKELSVENENSDLRD